MHCWKYSSGMPFSSVVTAFLIPSMPSQRLPVSIFLMIPLGLGKISNLINIIHFTLTGKPIRMPGISYILFSRGCPRGLIVTAMDYGILVSEFELQSTNYVHFRTNTLGKGAIPIIFSAMGQIVTLLFF